MKNKKHTPTPLKGVKMQISIKLLAVFVLLGILVFVFSKRWNAWFGNPVEPPYSANSEFPMRIQLTLGNEGQFSRNISWQCGNKLLPSHLFFTKTTSSDTAIMIAKWKILETQGGKTFMYHVKLTHLTEGEYSYCVSTYGKSSPWYRFRVSADSAFRFVFIGDIQDSIGGTVKNFFTSIAQREKDAAFWALGGDVVERPQDRYWNEYFTSMDSISQTTPIIACAGNHEYHKGISGKLEERFIYNFSYFLDSSSDGNAVFETRYGDAAIILLDSDRDTWTLFSQRRWLEQALQKAANARWKIVILHHPIYSVRGKLRHFFIRNLFDPLIRKYGVDLVLQGHEHCYARMITRDKNNIPATPVYVISQASPKDYRIQLDKKYDRFGNEMRFYQAIAVSADTLSLKTYTESGDLYDDVCIVKTGGKLQVQDLANGIIPEHFNPASFRLQK